MEKHFVLTNDGFELEMHRIPGNPKINKNLGRPVFLMHGLLDSSVAWVIMGPGKGLGKNHIYKDKFK